MSVEVVIYSGRDCHLCEVAKTELEAHRERLGLDIRAIDITGDAELESAFKFRVDPGDLERRVRLARQLED
jgi:glutaredoxin